MIFGGESYFRNTHFEQKQFPFSNAGSQVQTEKCKTECGKAGMLALHAKKRRENATT